VLGRPPVRRARWLRPAGPALPRVPAPPPPRRCRPGWRGAAVAPVAVARLLLPLGLRAPLWSLRPAVARRRGPGRWSCAGLSRLVWGALGCACAPRRSRPPQAPSAPPPGFSVLAGRRGPSGVGPLLARRPPPGPPPAAPPFFAPPGPSFCSRTTGAGPGAPWARPLAPLLRKPCAAASPPRGALPGPLPGRPLPRLLCVLPPRRPWACRCPRPAARVSTTGTHKFRPGPLARSLFCLRFPAPCSFPRWGFPVLAALLLPPKRPAAGSSWRLPLPPPLLPRFSCLFPCPPLPLLFPPPPPRPRARARRGSPCSGRRRRRPAVPAARLPASRGVGSRVLPLTLLRRLLPSASRRGLPRWAPPFAPGAWPPVAPGASARRRRRRRAPHLLALALAGAALGSFLPAGLGGGPGPGRGTRSSPPSPRRGGALPCPRSPPPFRFAGRPAPAAGGGRLAGLAAPVAPLLVSPLARLVLRSPVRPLPAAFSAPPPCRVCVRVCPASRALLPPPAAGPRCLCPLCVRCCPLAGPALLGLGSGFRPPPVAPARPRPRCAAPLLASRPASLGPRAACPRPVPGLRPWRPCPCRRGLSALVAPAAPSFVWRQWVLPRSPVRFRPRDIAPALPVALASRTRPRPSRFARPPACWLCHAPPRRRSRVPRSLPSCCPRPPAPRRCLRRFGAAFPSLLPRAAAVVWRLASLALRLACHRFALPGPRPASAPLPPGCPGTRRRLPGASVWLLPLHGSARLWASRPPRSASRAARPPASPPCLSCRSSRCPLLGLLEAPPAGPPLRPLPAWAALSAGLGGRRPRCGAACGDSLALGGRLGPPPPAGCPLARAASPPPRPWPGLRRAPGPPPCASALCPSCALTWRACLRPVAAARRVLPAPAAAAVPAGGGLPRPLVVVARLVRVALPVLGPLGLASPFVLGSALGARPRPRSARAACAARRALPAGGLLRPGCSHPCACGVGWPGCRRPLALPD